MKKPVDNSRFYRSTEFPVRDKVFNWVVRRYGVKGNKWEKSDDVVWGGFLYVVLSYGGYVVVVGALWWFLGKVMQYQGEAHALLLMLILIFVQLFRILGVLRKMGG